jgi:hypothetical protein
MTRCPSIFSKWLLTTLPTARLASSIGCGFLLALSTGCWSFPRSAGSWSGTVTPLKLYDGEKECRVAMLNISHGSEISPPIGKVVYLVDANDRLIDASSFSSGATVSVTGIAGMMEATDATGGNPTNRKHTNAGGAVRPSIEIDSITVSNDKKPTLRLAVARPSTQPSLTTMP